MKAARFSAFGGPEVLQIVELPDPHPGPDEVRIRVRAAGVNASDWKKRQGLMDQVLPQTLGYEAAGVVDEVGSRVAGVEIGDPVVGGCPDGAAQAELAVLSFWVPVPAGLGFVEAAALPAAAETAARALDRLGVESGKVLLINGASGSVGSAAVQIAVERGAMVVGTGSPATHDLLRSLGAEPVAYGPGMIVRVRAAAPGGIDLALDVAGNGVLPELVALVGSPDRVVTVADFAGARRCGVHFSSGEGGRAVGALGSVAQRAADGRFVVRVGRTFALNDIADAHRVGEAGQVRGKIVLVIDEEPSERESRGSRTASSLIAERAS
ncbi:NADPH:quinone reductase-like Zn-dependent oxidoreductase [Amnibacterium kyonggiense]|uniref:NADPH:quinone reductase-like Zn-dependent oxidoreductase n=1 Tax=Amnibacterium kyonggiense TaxID=595671 RepID=A0A4R7FRG7_9MICO|nr:NADP-dependent oxidoreductase [Amnibacterium kyonggiense]TDS80336.1 NADPH:quinone reductase-like Zn-dependent oxidoreductase [Amnibacterium kyonggiense]